MTPRWRPVIPWKLFVRSFGDNEEFSWFWLTTRPFVNVTSLQQKSSALDSKSEFNFLMKAHEPRTKNMTIVNMKKQIASWTFFAIYQNL
eukprot:UN03261